MPATAGAERDLSLSLAEWMDESAIPRDFRRRVAGNLSMSPLSAAANGDQVEKSIGAVLGGWLSVESLAVPRTAVPRGGTAEVTVVFRGISRVEPGWHLFMHLSSARGPFVNADHDLLDGLLPLPQVRPGQYVRDVVKIALPPGFPVGPAALELGLYRAGQRASVKGPAPVADPGLRVVHAATLEVR
jgi:hypothetical protein